MFVFVIVWFGQLVSLTGTYLTGFALGVWVFQRSGSVTYFSLITVATMLPGILISPIAGALVDRWDRRVTMILSDVGAGLCTLSIALLILGERLALWHLYLALAVSSICNAFQTPAYTATIPLLVPKKHLGRASGMTQLSEAVARILSPILGGVFLGLIQIWGVMLIDFATMFVAVGTLLLIRVPRPETTTSGAGKGSLWQEAVYGWHYITARPGLLGLLAFIAATNFSLGFVVTLIQPLLLGFTSPTVLGAVMSIGGLGMVFGSLAISVWGGPKHRVWGVLGATLIQGLLLFLGGLQPNITLITIAVCIFMFSDPFIFGCNQVIWQTKVAPDIQGRIFAFRNMVMLGSLVLAFVAAGPLADYVFEPLLAVDGLLAGSVGRIIGVGPGRGIGFLFMITGLLTVLATAAGFLYPRLRFVERELPDVIGETNAQEVT